MLRLSTLVLFSPLDTNTIIESVKKTHKAVIVHESVQLSGGFGGEVAAADHRQRSFSTILTLQSNVLVLCTAQCHLTRHLRLKHSLHQLRSKLQ